MIFAIAAAIDPRCEGYRLYWTSFCRAVQAVSLLTNSGRDLTIYERTIDNIFSIVPQVVLESANFRCALLPTQSFGQPMLLATVHFSENWSPKIKEGDELERVQQKCMAKAVRHVSALAFAVRFSVFVGHHFDGFLRFIPGGEASSE